MRMVPQQLGEPGAGLPISLTGKVIHKKVQMSIYIGFGFEYNGDRIRMVLHITGFRGDG